MIKSAIKHMIGLSGLQISYRRKYAKMSDDFYLPRELHPKSPTTHAAVIGTSRGAYGGPWKGDPDLFFPIFLNRLAQLGISSHLYHTPKDFLSCNEHYEIIVFIYNEEYVTTSDDINDFAAVEAQHADAIIVNPVSTAKILRNKTATNELLSRSGIAVPKIVAGNATAATFSAEMSGSHQPVSIVAEGQELDQSRYNVEFIDTRRTYENSQYYVSLRALAVGGEMIFAYPRARPVQEATDPSVHNADTPLSPKLLSWLYSTFIDSSEDKLRTLCQQLGTALGTGLFAHDILPSSDGRLIVCESGFKFEDSSYRKHLLPISADLPFLRDAFDARFAARSADAIAGLK